MARRRAKKVDGSPESVTFTAYLRAQGLKVTEERLGILQALIAEDRHVDAEGLYEELKDRGISRATVYRTLDLLVACGLIRKNSLGTKGAIFEAVRHGEHHDHLVCLVCGSVQEFFSEDLERLQDAVCSAHGFTPSRHNLAIFGHCRACQGS